MRDGFLCVGPWMGLCAYMLRAWEKYNIENIKVHIAHCNGSRAVNIAVYIIEGQTCTWQHQLLKFMSASSSVFLKSDCKLSMHFHNYHTQTQYSPTPPKEKKLHILVAIFQLLPLANWVRVQLLRLLPRWPQCSNVRMQVNANRSKVHCIWDCKTCHIDCKGRCLSPAYHEKLYNIKLRIEEWSRKRQSLTRRLRRACDSSPLP